MGFLKGVLSTIFLNAVGTYKELRDANLPNTGISIMTNTFSITLAYTIIVYAWIYVWPNYAKASDIGLVHAEIRVLSDASVR